MMGSAIHCVEAASTVARPFTATFRAASAPVLKRCSCDRLCLRATILLPSDHAKRIHASRNLRRNPRTRPGEQSFTATPSPLKHPRSLLKASRRFGDLGHLAGFFDRLVLRSQAFARPGPPWDPPRARIAPRRTAKLGS